MNQPMKTKQGPKIIYSVLPLSVKTDLQTHCEPGLLLSPEVRTERDLGGLGELALEKLGFKRCSHPPSGSAMFCALLTRTVRSEIYSLEMGYCLYFSY